VCDFYYYYYYYYYYCYCYTLHPFNGLFYAFTHPTDGTRGIMLSVCATFTLASVYLGRDISGWLAVEFLV